MKISILSATVRRSCTASSILSRTNAPPSRRSTGSASHRPNATATASAIAVAAATPATPQPNPITKTRSRTIFTPFRVSWCHSAARVFCTPMNQPSSAKFISVAGAPQIRTWKYSRARVSTSGVASTMANAAQAIGTCRTDQDQRRRDADHRGARETRPHLVRVVRAERLRRQPAGSHAQKSESPVDEREHQRAHGDAAQILCVGQVTHHRRVHGPQHRHRDIRDDDRPGEPPHPRMDFPFHATSVADCRRTSRKGLAARRVPHIFRHRQQMRRRWRHD